MNKIIGINATFEALLLNKVKELYLVEGFSNSKILDKAREKKIKMSFIEKKKFNSMFVGNHQGCVAICEPYKTYELDEIISDSKKVKNPIVVILDELSDPHNLGAILRSSDIFGVTGIIYKKHNNVSLNETVAKVSAGGINYVKCSVVSNLSNSILTLKKNGFWVIALDGKSDSSLKDIPCDVPLAVIIGSEGYGICRLVLKNSDLIVKIPQQGHVNCLNASVACGIVLYHLRNR